MITANTEVALNNMTKRKWTIYNYTLSGNNVKYVMLTCMKNTYKILCTNVISLLKGIKYQKNSFV